MVVGKLPLPQEGRPNFNHKALQHRDLLTPGPVVTELRIKPSPFQELARRSSKRKADALTVDSSSESAQEGPQPSSQPGNFQPIKTLKVVHHRFSNGESPIEELAASQKPRRSDDGTTTGLAPQSGEEDDRQRATPSHLMYQSTRTGKWRSTEQQPKKYHLGPGDGELFSARASRPRTDQNCHTDIETPTSASGDQVAARDKTDGEYASNETVSSSHLCTGLACEHPNCNMTIEQKDFTSGLLADYTLINGVQVDKPLPRDHTISVGVPDDQHALFNHRGSGEPDQNTLEWFQYQPLSVREMAMSLYPEIPDDNQAPKIEDGDFADLHTLLAASPPVSPNASGQVWESRATRRGRRHQELDLNPNDPSTPTLPTFNDTTRSYPSSYDPSLLEDTASTTTNNPKPFSAPPNTDLIPLTTTAATPRRFRNQDSQCLICLRPVTPLDLAIADLRCVVCPRTFHSSCLTYIPPSMNQNWRCSLCYRESWHGYGHLPAERDVLNPTLVERYRRRLVLAKTYAGNFLIGNGCGREGGGGPESVRFWFEVDLDGGLQGDQEVLVRMGVVNGWKLRVVGVGEGGPRVAPPVEEVERWGIALGMALQAEERKVEELRAEVERLRGVVGEKEAEIRDLEGGL